jgi:large subunit ribosomal protein L11
MAKEVVAKIKLQAPGGKATPAPPIGPALGQHNVNIGQFVSQFNEATREFNGMPIPVVISVYGDRTFSFEIKSPPAAALLKEAAQVAQGSGTPTSVRPRLSGIA